MIDWKLYCLLFVSAALAGAINSVAGGGTLLTFPALLYANVAATVANATSTLSLLPGAFTSLWGYRKEVGKNYRTLLKLMLPSLIGGVFGAFLLLSTPPEIFKRLVPYLILAATLLFVIQEPLSRHLRAKAETVSPGETELPEEASFTKLTWAGAMLFQFFVAIYGGYFGAGAGILMLAAFGMMGFRNIHRMNGIKNINALCINVIASIMFISNYLIRWDCVLVMSIGAALGGYGGSGIARRIGQKNVRRLIICIGFAMSVTLFFKK